MNLRFTTQEKTQFDLLILNAQMNHLEAQRFSVEAAKLLTAAVKSIRAYKKGGFFKHCWSGINGSSMEHICANLYDLEGVKKFSFCYLMKLLEQNLIDEKTMPRMWCNLNYRMVEDEQVNAMICLIQMKLDARIAREGVKKTSRSLC